MFFILFCKLVNVYGMLYVNLNLIIMEMLIHVLKHMNS